MLFSFQIAVITIPEIIIHNNNHIIELLSYNLMRINISRIMIYSIRNKL